MPKKKITDCGCCGDDCSGFCASSAPAQYQISVPASMFDPAGGAGDCTSGECDERTGDILLDKIDPADGDVGPLPEEWVSSTEPPAGACMYVSEVFTTCGHNFSAPPQTDYDWRWQLEIFDNGGGTHSVRLFLVSSESGTGLRYAFFIDDGFGFEELQTDGADCDAGWTFTYNAAGSALNSDGCAVDTAGTIDATLPP